MSTMPRRSSGNRAVLHLLHSPVRRLLGGQVCELRYLGRTSGFARRLPVEYVRADNRLFVLAAHASTKQWWRNFRGGRELHVMLDDVAHRAVAVALAPGERGYAAAMAQYTRHRRAPADWDHRLVVIQLLS